MKQRLASLVLLFVATVAYGANPQPSAAPAVEVNLLSMGDWGRGGPLQKSVADALSRHVEKTGKRFDALLTAGDNFYPYLESTRDPKWKTLFEDMYDPRTLDFPFYITLGNHDYDNGKGDLAHIPKAEVEFAYARENPKSRWKLPANWYRLDFPSTGRPLVSVLMLNSNRPKLSDAQWAEQLKFIDTELADRKGATWMVACAHHPLYSNGSHGDNGVLQTHWGPLFRMHNLDLYLAGHDHDLQHLQLPDHKTSFLLVGGGGATTRAMRRDNRGPFSQSTYGFTSLRFSPDQATVSFISAKDTSVLHQFTRTPGGQTTIVKQGSTSPATTKQLQAIQGIDQRKE